MDAILFALTLEVVLQHLRIIEGSTELRIRSWKMDDKSARLQRDKLGRDREVVKDTMRLTLLELIEKGQFSTLQKSGQELITKASSAVSQKEQYEQLHKSHKNLIEESNTKRHLWETELRNADFKMAQLRDKMNDDQLNANLRLAYAEKWILARMESLELQFDKPRPRLPRMDHEERVHKEILKVYDLQIEEKEKTLQYWQDRFAVDTVDITARLMAKCEELRVATARRVELQKIAISRFAKDLDAALQGHANTSQYDTHEAAIEAWLTFKRQRAERIAYEEKLRQSATLIQSWWRGEMVRRALGAFRYLKNMKKTPSKGKKK